MGPEQEDLRRTAQLMNRYADLPLGFSDACSIALAERNLDEVVASLDNHFRIVKPAHCTSFHVLPLRSRVFAWPVARRRSEMIPSPTPNRAINLQLPSGRARPSIAAPRRTSPCTPESPLRPGSEIHRVELVHTHHLWNGSFINENFRLASPVDGVFGQEIRLEVILMRAAS